MVIILVTLPFRTCSRKTNLSAWLGQEGAGPVTAAGAGGLGAVAACASVSPPARCWRAQCGEPCQGRAPDKKQLGRSQAQETLSGKRVTGCFRGSVRRRWAPLGGGDLPALLIRHSAGT